MRDKQPAFGTITYSQSSRGKIATFCAATTTAIIPRKIIMLVLRRKENESVVIDGNIQVTILEIRGSQIRLGIEAPKDMPICRSELKSLAAKQRLQTHTHLSLQRILCDFEKGRLFLRGQVPSFYLKQLAQTAVAGLDGVRQVVNEIEVVW
jgi:carbon storage regulator CsrA